MALKKSKTLKSGISAEYWKIKHYTHDPSLKVIEGVLEPYVTEDLRGSGASPIAGERIHFRLEPEKVTEEVIEEVESGKFDSAGKPIMKPVPIQKETGEIIWPFDTDTMDKKGNNIIKQIYSEIKRTHPDFLDAEDC